MWPLLQICSDNMLIQALQRERERCVGLRWVLWCSSWTHQDFRDKWKNINQKGINMQSVRLLSSRTQTRLVLPMHGFPLITLHLGDQSHCIAGFREAVSSCMTETNTAKALVQAKQINCQRDVMSWMWKLLRLHFFSSEPHFENSSLVCHVTIDHISVTACHLFLFILPGNKHESGSAYAQKWSVVWDDDELQKTELLIKRWLLTFFFFNNGTLSVSHRWMNKWSHKSVLVCVCPGDFVQWVQQLPNFKEGVCGVFFRLYSVPLVPM